jgi:integrase
MYERGDIWISDFKINGIRHKKSWGPISKTKAKEKEEKYKTEIRDGKQDLKSRNMLFETLSEKYLEYARLNKKPKSAKRNETSIAMLLPLFKGKTLKSIDPLMLERYKKLRKDLGAAPGTINRDIDCVRNMMKKAVEWRFISQNPFTDIKRFKEKSEKMWILTPEEEKSLLEACQKSPQRKKAKYLRDLVSFGLHSGMREAEIFNVRKDHVDLRNSFILVTETKNNESRKVPVNATLREILTRRTKDEGSDYIFYNSKGRKLTVLTNAFWYAIKKVGLVRFESEKTIRFRFHDLRHTFGSRLGMAHTDLKTIMEIMGHKTTKVAMMYQHPTPLHKLEAVRILDQIPPVFTPGEKEEQKVVNLFK